MAEIKWIKLAVDIFDDEKILAIRDMPGGDNIIIIWLNLLCLAGKNNSDGRLFLSENLPISEKIFAKLFRVSENKIKKSFEIFEKFGMISRENGVVKIINWEKHQSIEKLDKIRENGRQRVKKYRQKNAECNAECNVTVTSNVTPCNAIEEEREEEGDKEKEYHSFTLSNAREEILQNENHALEEECNAVENSLSDIFSARKTLRGIGKNVVMLSDAQMNDLLERLSLEEFNRYVGVIADNELSGKHYRRRTHYQAILDMAKKDRRLRGV